MNTYSSRKDSVSPVIELPEEYTVFDFTRGYDPGEIRKLLAKGGRGVGRYNEKRAGMYVAPQYNNRRNIHMGIDFWAPAGEPVYAALPGEVMYQAYHPEEGNYGATLVLKHRFAGSDIFALYGHLSRASLRYLSENSVVEAGEVVGRLGDESENGNWPPHLHYQLSLYDPGEADLPGVVAEEERGEALKRYPDPRIIVGNLYPDSG